MTLTIRKLEQEILAAGHSVCVLTTLSGDPANTHLEGQHPNRRVLFLDNAIPIPFVNDPNAPELTYQLGFSLSRSVKRQLSEFEPTLIHITAPDCTALHLIEYARRKEIPIMGTYHSNIPEYMDHYPGLGWLKPILGGFFRHQYNFLQALYVPTPFIRRHLTDTYQLDRATRLGIWGRGVDVQRFHPQHCYAAGGKFRAQLGLGENDVVLCWVGRLVPEKRVDIFCDTVRRLDAMGLPFHAIVVGAGPSEDEIRSLPKTTFCGWMNADQLAVAYASSDIFLFPSSVETFGNVTLEAMASGLPIVVEGGCSGHLVEEGVNGYACSTGSFDEFFEATAALVKDKSKRLLFGKNSRAKAETLESCTVVRRMLHNYQTLTEEFYSEYGGRHANRDKAYNFFAGNLPRPILLVMVEWLFIVLFQVLWNMSQLFLSAQDAILRRRGDTSSVPISAASLRLPQEPARTSVTHPPKADKVTSLPNDKKAEESSDDELAEGKNKISGSPKSRRRCSTSDVPMAMAVSFIRSMEFICRLEGHLRHGMTSYGTRTLRLRKRKHSFEVLSPRQVDSVETGAKTSHKDPLDISGNRHSTSSAMRSRGGGSMSGSNMKEFLDAVYLDSPSSSVSSSGDSVPLQVV